MCVLCVQAVKAQKDVQAHLSLCCLRTGKVSKSYELVQVYYAYLRESVLLWVDIIINTVHIQF